MLNVWQERFPGCEPVGYQLKLEFPDRWVRFHSLPDSKRYPESEAEYAILLERHNSILSELARDGGRVALLTTGYSETCEPVRSCELLTEFDPTALPWRTIAMHKAEKDFTVPGFWHVFKSEWKWTASVFDPVVRLVAEDRVVNIIIVALDCRWLLHPYDGGMDVILDSSAARDRLKARYSNWLSARKDGF